MNYSFDKHVLSKGKSYPLKRSELDAALEKFYISQVHVIYFWLRQNGDVVLRADYCGETKKERFAAGKSSITLYAVPCTERHTTKMLLTEQGLPALCTWLGKAEAAGNVWRHKDHALVIRCTQGKLSFVET